MKGTVMILKSILERVGETPIVHLSRMFGSSRHQVYAKLELLNPAGSVKDRPARYIIERGLAEGSIRPGTHIVESSSGNLAIALAMVCRIHGLSFTAVVDPKISSANLQIIRSYGARTHMVTEQDSQGGYLETRIQHVKRLLQDDPQAVWINQYANEYNWLSHYHGEGEEILRQMDQAPDYLVLGVSTSGTLHGIARRLREQWPALKVVGVDAVGSVLFGTPSGARELPGIGASRVPELLKREEIPQSIHIDDYESAVACRQLVEREGIFAGGSSGSVMAAIQRLGASLQQPSRILTVLPDRGDRYLDTVYDDTWLQRMQQRHLQRSAPSPATDLEPIGLPA
jgi:cysteine synthase A